MRGVEGGQRVAIKLPDGLDWVVAFLGAIWAGGVAVGEVVSGTQSPSLNNGIGMGYVPPQFAVIGGKIEIEVRGRRFAAEMVKKPIYKKAA